MHWHKLAGVDGYGKCQVYATGYWRLERKTVNGYVEWALGLYRKDMRGLYILHCQGWYRRMREAKAAAEKQVARARDVLEGQQ